MVFARQSMRLFQEERKNANRGVRDLLLLFYYESGRERRPAELLLETILPILGEPSEIGVSMDEWWQETRDYSGLNDYYCLLKGCSWTVWRTQRSNISGKQLRIMMTVGRRMSTKVLLAIHLQIIGVQAD